MPMGFAGGIADAATTWVLGRAVRRDQQQLERSQFGWLQSQGATIPEILGSGGAGGGPYAQGPTLGNGVDAVGAAGLRLEKYKADLSAKTALAIADKQYGAGPPSAGNIPTQQLEVSQQQVRAAMMQATSGARDADTRRRAQIVEASVAEVQKRLLEENIRTAKPEFIVFRTAMTMGVENLRVTALYALAKSQGVDLINPSGAVDERTFVNWLARLRGESSQMATGIVGMATLADMLAWLVADDLDDMLPERSNDSPQVTPAPSIGRGGPSMLGRRRPMFQ